jgi:transcriptional regulator with XRE-family HTH domain
MKPVDRKAFGERVARRREKLGMSQPELAREVGMKQQGIDHIEHGAVSRPRLLRELAAKLNTTEQWLLWNEGPENAVASAFNVISVPLIPSESAADVEPHLDDVPHLAVADLGRGTFFGLRVEDDSMDRISPPGSIIIVDRDDRELVKDRSYVFSVRGETTYKRWQPDPPHLAPYSINPVHQPIFIKRMKDLGVIGRVCRTVLDL